MIEEKLYRIWFFNSNNRGEMARILSNSFEQVQDFILNSSDFINQQYKDEIEKTDFGLEWNICKECRENQKNQRYEDFEEQCNFCECYLEGYQIEELEDYTKEECDFKTIFGTNDFYDLTEKEPTKAKDWNLFPKILRLYEYFQVLQV